jgi:uncharacterized membrane protein HdeD (DUF308 family)
MNPAHDLHHNWGWIMLFGFLSVALGLFAITWSVLFTVISVFWLAWILIVAGVIEGVHAIRHHEQGHLVWYILEALLAIVIGALLLRSPLIGAMAVTLLLATYFVVAGIFRIVAAVVLHLPHRGWVLFNGLLTLALGIIVWGGWPASSFWVLGLFIGITLLVTGFSRIMLAMALRSDHFHAMPV